MKSIITQLIVVTVLVQLALSDDTDTIILKPESASGKQITIVWGGGMQCQQKDYVDIAKNLQRIGQSLYGYSITVAIPKFTLDAPPIFYGDTIDDVVEELKGKGISLDQAFLTGHSLGGVFAQNYIKDQKTPVFKGLILMASTLLRANRNLTKEGKTKFDIGIPTMTLSGTKDGLMRCSRIAESYWHVKHNIEDSQVGMFPVIAIDGLSHAGFMATDDLPSHVKDSDLIQDISQEDGYNAVANNIISFVGQVIGDNKVKNIAQDSEDFTDEFFGPFVEAMELEGFNHLKPPCYNESLVNDISKTCLQGSRSSEIAQRIMAGDIQSDSIEISTQDNFHRVWTILPVHLPQVNNSCNRNKTEPCKLNTITVTENIYDSLDDFDVGEFPVAASEQKVKMVSRQRIEEKVGFYKPNFHQTDEVGNRCQEINQQSLDWALGKAGQKQKSLYDKLGKKLVMGADLGPFNAGPLWIWQYLTYTDSKDKLTTLMQSPMMRTPTDYPIEAASGFHYCKVLSPFRALEWIYVDSQKDRGSIKAMSQHKKIKNFLFRIIDE